MTLIEHDAGTNAPEYTVSELAGAVKRTLEGGFGRVRVRGEIGRVSRAASGHTYFGLKDDRAVLDAVIWRGQAGALAVKPEEGIEVIATGRLTTFPASSKYQLVVEALEPAGLGALMLMLEKRRAALAAEGLFDAARKKPLPYLPEVIGVVTSPTGAVIRDILHRLRDRFPRRVLIWPVAVQGERCAAEVAAAIRGFNAIAPGGPVPRPDLLIVARGGGSFEDLMGFNDEGVVRAAAASAIPLISAVGHETDTTLIDHAADRRAPTPTAAAEMAVPVRLDLAAAVDTLGARAGRAMADAHGRRRQAARDLARALPRPEALVETARQRLDLASERLRAALAVPVAARRQRLAEVAAGLRPRLLADLVARARLAERQAAARLPLALAARIGRARDRFDPLAARLAPARDRALADVAVALVRDRTALGALAARLDTALPARLAALRERAEATDRLRLSLGPAETLRRGYAIVRGDGAVVTTRAAAERANALELEFHDGRLPLPPRRRGAARPPPGQGSLF
jgi:exodeoxyribonuclease VII large subunit